MRLDTVVMLCLGLCIEVLSLWEVARRERGTTIYLSYLPRWLPPERLVMVFLTVVALLALGLFRLTGVQEMVTPLADAFISAMAVIAGLFAFYFGLLDPFLLPRVNEQMLFTIYVALCAGALLSGDLKVANRWGLLGMAALGVLLLWASMSGRRMPLGVQALIYLGYLSVTYWIGYQQVNALVTAPTSDLMPVDGFTIGVGGMFTVLHMLFWIRFFLIVSSMVVPQHWQYLGPIMGRLFANTQNAPRDVALSVGSALGVLILNQLTGALPVSQVVGFLMPVIVQGLNLSRLLRGT